MELYLPPKNAKIKKGMEFYYVRKDTEKHRMQVEQCRRMREIRWSDPAQHEKVAHNAKPINAYEVTTGKYLGTWPSSCRAQLALGIAKDMKEAKKNSNHVRQVANHAHGQRSYKGYIFEFDNGDHSDIEPFIYDHRKTFSKPVVVTTPEGEVHRFDFTYEAAEFIGCSSGLVQIACAGRIKRAKGHTCRWENERDIDRGKRSKAARERRIGQRGFRCALYIWDVFIGEYPSLTQLSKDNGLPYTSVQCWYHKDKENTKHIKIVKL